MSYANALSKNIVKTPMVFKKLPDEKILFVIDSYALSKLDIDFNTNKMEPMSSLAVIQEAYKLFALQKNCLQNNYFGICILTSQSYKMIMDFTTNINKIIETLNSISIQNDKSEIASYDFGPLLRYVGELRILHKDCILRVIMTYNRDDCFPIIDPLDRNTFNLFCSSTFYFDIVYVCEKNIEHDSTAQNIYGKLALLCNAWSYKACVQRKPISIINGIVSLLPNPQLRKAQN